jgi:23S rRNA (guanosine2251-2'-O)-methyltransferase
MKKESGIYIYGRKPIEEALLAHPKNVKIVYVRDSVRDNDVEEVRKYLVKNKIPIVKTPQEKIISMVGDVNDQGFVAELKEFKSLDFSEWLSGVDLEKNPLVFVLDELEDPHNVGAVIRVACASGAAGVILSKHRQAPINATVFKTSAGTVAKMPIVVVSNTNDALRKLKDEKFWIVGLDADASKNIFEEAFDAPIAVVVGNEGRGVREKTKETCTPFALSLKMMPEIKYPEMTKKTSTPTLPLGKYYHHP